MKKTNYGPRAKRSNSIKYVSHKRRGKLRFISLISVVALTFGIFEQTSFSAHATTEDTPSTQSANNTPITSNSTAATNGTQATIDDTNTANTTTSSSEPETTTGEAQSQTASNVDNTTASPTESSKSNTTSNSLTATTSREVTVGTAATANNITVTFDSEGGDYIAPLTLPLLPTGGAYVPNDTIPTRDGYAFDGWFTSADYTKEINKGQLFYQDTTLYAKWVRPLTLNIPGDITINYGDSLDIMNNVSGTGLDGNVADFLNLPFSGSQSVINGLYLSAYVMYGSANAVFYVGYDSYSENSSNTVWTPKASGTYTIEYSFYLGNSPTVHYYGYAPQNIVTLTRTVTVTQPAVTFTINFDSNGGESVPSQTVDIYGTSTEPKTPKKSGYTFDGWYTDESLTHQFDFTSSIISDYTLYAKWIPTSSTTTTGNTSTSTTVSSNKNMSNSRATANVTLTDLSKNNKLNTNVNSEKGEKLPTTGERSSVFLYMVGLFSLLGATWLSFHRKIKSCDCSL